VIANTHRDPKKGKAFTPQDFMPQKEVKKKARVELTAKEIQDRLTAITYAFGGKVVKKE